MNYLFSTVHPNNHASVRLLEKEGFEMLEQKPMFKEKLMRKLMFLDLNRMKTDDSR